MSDLAATNCGCGCDNNFCNGGNSCCNLIIWIIILSLICGNGSFGFGGCGNDDCGCGGNGIFGGNSCIWIILLLLFCGGNNGGCGCC